MTVYEARFYILVGERLTELRIKNNMTQEEFAEYMCVTRQSVSKWETDKTYPDVEKLIKIAELYNVSLDYLIRGQEPNAEATVTDIEPKAMAEDDSSVNNEDRVPHSNTSKTGLKLCLGVSALFVLMSLVMLVMFLVQNPWFHSKLSEQSVRVEEVYSQLSMAQISFEDEQGEEHTELVLLDTANVHQGDYISTYVSPEGGIFIDYGAGILIGVIVFFLLNLAVAILLVKELNMV